MMQLEKSLINKNPKLAEHISGLRNSFSNGENLNTEDFDVEKRHARNIMLDTLKKKKKGNAERNSSLKIFSKLTVSQKKVPGWVGTTLGIKISIISPNGLSCGSKIREKLS